MRRIHLLRYDGEPDGLAALLEAARAEGLRVGWLEIRPDAPGPVPAGLEAAASAGAFRAVAVGEGRSVAVKAPGGPPALADLLREHFLGCALVVVHVPADGGGRLGDELARLPAVEPAEPGYRVRPPGEAARTFAPTALASRLRRPRPW